MYSLELLLKQLLFTSIITLDIDTSTAKSVSFFGWGRDNGAST